MFCHLRKVFYKINTEIFSFEDEDVTEGQGGRRRWLGHLCPVLMTGPQVAKTLDPSPPPSFLQPPSPEKEPCILREAVLMEITELVTQLLPGLGSWMESLSTILLLSMGHQLLASVSSKCTNTS